MRVIEQEKKENTNFLPFLVSIIPPSVFLLYLYQRNAASLSIWHTLIAIAIFIIGAVVLYLFISKLLKSPGAAAIICDVLWIIFFTIKAPYLSINLFVRKNVAIYLCIMIPIVAIIIILIVCYKSKFQKKEIYKILSVFWFVLFMFNAVPTVFYAIGNHSTYISDEKNYKTEFIVDNNLPSPNIYWLFMDGMLGFKAMELLFNNSQMEFTSKLTERGFKINQNAQFEALHSTVYCIPVLMSPHYYDTLFISELRNIDNYKQKIKLRFNDIKFNKSVILAGKKMELITAFERKGYLTNIITGSNFSFLYPCTDNYYSNKKKIKKDDINENGLDKLEALKSFISLLYNTSPVSRLYFIIDPIIKKYESTMFISTPIPKLSVNISDNPKAFFREYQWYMDAFLDIEKYSMPKLVIIHDARAHYPFLYDEYGNQIKRKRKEDFDPYNYPSQHYFVATIVISYIDFILNLDPEAIIILQSDHGLHSEDTRQQLIFKYGKNDEDVRIMQNQTISAVRIPEKWGGLDEPVEPPNITRLLVNRYVGENYKMLPPEDIIK